MKYRENEKGVALLLALGFAALLLVLIMGFATNALIERKVAANNGDKTQARGLAMSAVNRAIVAMQYQMLEQIKSSYDQGLHRFDNIVSKTNTSENGLSDSDIESVFYKLAAERYLLKYRDNVYIYEYPKNDIDYSYNNGGSSLNNIPRRPQWQYVKNTDSTPKVIGRFWYAVLPDLGRVYKKADGSGKADKKGYYINEFDIKQFSNNMNDSDIDFEHIAQWSAEIDADSSLAFKDRAFWVFNAVEPRKSSETENKRNTYYRNSSDKFEKKIVDVFAADLTAEKLSDDADYLSDKKTLAANIIGMFNNSSINNTNRISDKENWLTDTPTYTGNMLTPYLNEVEVSLSNFTGTVTDKGDTNSDGTVEYSIEPSVDVTVTFELYDPFHRGLGSSSRIIPKNLKASIAFIKDGTQQGEPKEIELTELTTTGGTEKYFTISGKATVKGAAVTGESGFKIKARLAEFEADFIYKRDDKYVDYVKALQKDADSVQGETAELTINSQSVTPVNGISIFSAQAKDALNNFEGSNWIINQPSTIGSVNKNTDGTSMTENPMFADDKLSKYVKGESEEPTLADLRFVSKGTDNALVDILGADRELLDQITTVKDTEPQLIDINTRSVRVWKGLLTGIKKDGSDDYILSDVDTVAKNVSAKIRDEKKFFKRRSDAVEVLASKLDADVDSPLLVGKFISLCKTEDYPEYVNLVVVAQTVKDNEGLGSVGTFDKDDDIITSEVRYLVKLRRTEDYKMEIISIEELID